MAVIEIKSVSAWSDAPTNLSERLTSCCIVSAPLWTESTRLSNLEADWTFMLLQTFLLCSFILFGLDCPNTGVAMLNCGLARNSVWRASSSSFVYLFLAQ